MSSNGQFIGSDDLPTRAKFATLLSCFQRRRGPSVAALLQTELHEVAIQVRAEVQELGFPNLSVREKTKRLLFLFQCDLLPGLSRQILCSKGGRDSTASNRPVAPWLKAVGYLIVLVADAAMLFYVFLFALQQSKVRQVCMYNDKRICQVGWVTLVCFRLPGYGLS